MDPAPLIRCCEHCATFRRRDDGLPICMATTRNPAERNEQGRALKGTNARCKCALFMPIADEEPEDEA